MNCAVKKIDYKEIDGVLVREGAAIMTGSVIFDIDGVLIDVSCSFRKAIIETVQFYFENIIRIPIKGKLLTVEDTQLFKDTGGFNNDWDLTISAVLFFLSKLVSYPKEYLGLNFNESLDEYVKNVSLKGSSLEAAKEEAFKKLTIAQKEDFLKLFDPVKIKRIFQEMYGGTDYCFKLYGFAPEFIEAKGFIDDEINMIDYLLVKDFDNVGILTGRTKEETELALEKTGLTDLVKENVFFDDGNNPRKPDPACLKELCSKMKVKSGIYIGDTVDDAKLVVNYNAVSSDGKFSFAAVTSRPEVFTGKADLIADDVNGVVRYLSQQLAVSS